MNPTEHDRLLALFGHAAADIPAGPHVADDELLTAWRLGDLSTDEDARFHDHLASCAGCRRLVADLSEAEAPAAAAVAASGPTPATFPWRSVLGAVAALAACLVVAVVWIGMPSSAAREMAQAEAEYNDGKSDAALARLMRIPSDRLTAGEREKRSQLLERAAYQSIRDDLEAGRHDDASSRYTVASAAGATSPRLDGLKVIADNRLPLKATLTTGGGLLARGFLPNGSLPMMGGVPVPNDAARAAWESVVAKNPSDPTVLVGAAEFMLSQRRFAEARDLYRRVAGQRPEEPAGHIGLGLVAAAEENFVTALAHFRRAYDLAPDSPAVLIDLAVCYEALDDAVSARPLWEKALGKLPAGKVRTCIARHLKME